MRLKAVEVSLFTVIRTSWSEQAGTGRGWGWERGQETQNPSSHQIILNQCNIYWLIDHEPGAQILNPSYRKKVARRTKDMFLQTPLAPGPKGELDRRHHLESTSSGLTTTGRIQMEKLVKRISYLHTFAFICIPAQEHVVHSQAIFKQMWLLPPSGCHG